MIEKLKDRHNQMIAFFALFIMVLFVRLFVLTIVEGSEYKKIADEIIVKKIPISSPRGEIRDRYGRLLAGNKASFTVQIMKNELIDEKINEVSIKLLNILIDNNEKYVDNFPIIQENNRFGYTFDREIDEWLNDQGIIGTRSAKEVFDLLRQRLQIPPELDEFEAQELMQTEYQIYPPISVKTMKFIPEMQKENFLKQYNLDEKLSAEEAFKLLRENFKIDDNISDIDARKILMIRNEFREQGYKQYQPVKIALNVSSKTVATIEEKSMELPGVNVEVEPIRYYPNDSLASHIIGYLGKISDSETEKFVKELGYLRNDLIGKDGIERVFEKNLKGIDGAKYVEVDSAGRLINVLMEEKPQKGETLYLTLDFKLQKVAEEALEQALKEIQIGGTFKSQWGDYKYSEAFKNATSGAVVALDAKTGEVLAMASAPSFNPNLFATGISAKDWKMLQDNNPRDPLSPLPLFNVATQSAVQPGSTFKMITGLAAIEQGLSPTKKLYDGGSIVEGGRSFGCWLWNQSKSSHGWVDLYKALEVSCNYYFYDVVVGWDHYLKQPLGISMNVDKLLEYAAMFGLGEPTGIEIYETAYGVPSEQKNINTMKALLRNHLNARAAEYFMPNLVEDKEKLKEEIGKIIGWAEENPSRGTIIKRLGEMSVHKEKIEPLADLMKFNYFNRAKWTKGDAFNLSIGQGAHTYTPIQMANYIATMANGGYKNKVSVVRKLEGEIEPKLDENKEAQKIPLKDASNLEHINKGMERVISGEEGTSRAIFRNFPVAVTAKTGTAQRSGKIQPKDEAQYLRQYLRWIAPNINLTSVESKAEELMMANRGKYKDIGIAMRDAIKLLSNGKITDTALDQFKDNYDNFAWYVSYAPFDDPQIVVVSLIVQGGHGGYAAPIAREIIGEYLGLKKEYEKVDLKNTLAD